MRQTRYSAGRSCSSPLLFLCVLLFYAVSFSAGGVYEPFDAVTNAPALPPGWVNLSGAWNTTNIGSQAWTPNLTARLAASAPTTNEAWAVSPAVSEVTPGFVVQLCGRGSSGAGSERLDILASTAAVVTATSDFTITIASDLDAPTNWSAWSYHALNSTAVSNLVGATNVSFAIRGRVSGTNTLDVDSVLLSPGLTPGETEHFDGPQFDATWTSDKLYSPWPYEAAWSHVTNGGGRAEFNSAGLFAANLSARLSHLNELTTSNANLVVQFALYNHQAETPPNDETVQVRYTLDGGLTWLNIQTPFYRYDSGFPDEEWRTCKVSVFDTNLLASSRIRVGFVAKTLTGGSMRNVRVDDVKVVFATSVTFGNEKLCTDSGAELAGAINYTNAPFLRLDTESTPPGDASITDVTLYYRVGATGGFSVVGMTNATALGSNTWMTSDSLGAHEAGSEIQYAVKCRFASASGSDDTSPEWFPTGGTNAPRSYTVEGAGSVWVNEVFADAASTDAHYIELASYDGRSVSGWDVQVVTNLTNGVDSVTYDVAATYAFTNLFGNDSNGYGFYVLGAGAVGGRDQTLTAALPGVGGIRLVNSEGGLEHALSYGTTNAYDGFSFGGAATSGASVAAGGYAPYSTGIRAAFYTNFAWSSSGVTPGAGNPQQGFYVPMAFSVTGLVADASNGIGIGGAAISISATLSGNRTIGADVNADSAGAFAWTNVVFENDVTSGIPCTVGGAAFGYTTNATTGSLTAGDTDSPPVNAVGLTLEPGEAFERFDRGVLPSYWQSTRVASTSPYVPEWKYIDETRYPSGLRGHDSPTGTVGMVYFNSRNIFLTPNDARLSHINTLGMGGQPNLEVGYWILNTEDGSPGQDLIQVQYSTNNGTSWIDLGAEDERYDASYPVNTWRERRVSLYDPSLVSNDLRIAFLAKAGISVDDVYLDDIRVSMGVAVGIANLAVAPVVPRHTNAVDVSVNLTRLGSVVSNVMPAVVYRTNGGAWTTNNMLAAPIALLPASTNVTAEDAIPAQPPSTLVEYYVQVTFMGTGSDGTSPRFFPDNGDGVVPTTPRSYIVPAVIDSVYSTTADGVYRAGSNINVTVGFSGPVTLSGGDLRVALNSGGYADIAPFAASTTGAGLYAVGAGQDCAGLVATGLSLRGGATLRDAGGSDIVLSVPAQNLAGNSIAIDTVSPTVTSLTPAPVSGLHNTGDVIEVVLTFDETVSLAGGTFQVALDAGASAFATVAPFGPATSATGLYTVAVGHSSPDLNAVGLALNGGARLRDQADNPADLALPAGNNIADNGSVRIDGVLPTIASITSDSADKAYTTNGNINVIVTFSEPVALSGSNLVVGLNSGGSAEIAPFGLSATASAVYTVGAGENGDPLAATNAWLAGTALRDEAGNDADLSIAAATNFAGKQIVVDTIPFWITSITSTTTNGLYGTGDVINVSLALSEEVSGANMAVALDSGGSCTIDPAASDTAVSGNYIVGAGDTSTDLRATGVDAGPVRDRAGNGLDPSKWPPPVNIDDGSTLRIDGIAPTVTRVRSTSDDVVPYGQGQSIDVTLDFSEQVALTSGAIVVELNTSTNTDIGPFTLTNSVSTAYTVGDGDTNARDPDFFNATGLWFVADYPRDEAGNVLSTVMPDVTITNDKSIEVDAATPRVYSVTSTNASGAYTTNAAIDVTVEFAEAVTLSSTTGGVLRVLLSAGATAFADIAPFATNTVVSGTYAVAAGENTESLSVTGLVLTGDAALEDGVGNQANLDDLSLPGGNMADREIVVDTTVPTVISIESTTADGIYSSNAQINVKLTFSEAVTLSGNSMRIELDSGGPVDVAPFAATNVVSHDYTVSSGENSEDLTVTNLALAVGATLRDRAANSVDRTLPAGQNIADTRDIVVDTTIPTIVSIASSTADGAYTTGSTINVTVTFSEAVALSGSNMVVELDSGGTVSFVPFASTDTVAAVYTVGSGEDSEDLVANGVSLAAGATLRDRAGIDTVLALPPGRNIADTSDIVVDTTIPTIVSIASSTANGAYTLNDTIDVTISFSEPLTLSNGDMVVTLNSGGAVTIGPFAAQQSVSGVYTVGAGENTEDLAVNDVSLDGGAVLHDRSGNATDRTLPPGGNIADTSDIVVDTVIPTIASITSTTPNGTYTTNETIDVTLTFSEPVTLAGDTMTVALDSGGAVTIDPFGPADTVAGTYTVGAGEDSEDLTATSVTPNGAATLCDRVDGEADRSLPAGQNIADTSDIVVDSTVPVITAVRSTTADGAYTTNETVNVTVDFSEPVTLAGDAMTVALNCGGAVRIDPFGPASQASGTYTVGAGENTEDLSATAADLTGAATLRDRADNDVDRTLPAGSNVADSSDIVVDTTIPTITAITAAPTNGLFGVGAAIQTIVVCSEPVTLAGSNLLVRMNSGGDGLVAPFGPADVVTGVYVVARNDVSPELDSTNVATASGATLLDRAGNAANLGVGGIPTIADTCDIVVDGILPEITAIVSTTPAGLYNTGDVINVALTFSEPVALAGGNLEVRFNSGGAADIVPFGTLTNAASGGYTVAVGDSTPNLDGANAVLAGGATLRDAAGNNADLTAWPPATNVDDDGQVRAIDGVLPYVASIASASPDGFYRSGDKINVTLTFSEQVTLAGSGFRAIGLGLNSGGSVSYTAFSQKTVREIDYEVLAGHNSPRLAGAGDLAIVGNGELVDAAGNHCILTLPPADNFAANEIVVDTTAPAFLGVHSVDSGGVFRAGDNIGLRLTFNDAATGAVTVCFENGAETNLAWTTPVSVVTNVYVPGAGADTTNLTVTNVAGYVVDRAGNDRVVSDGGPYPLSLEIDTIAPTIEAIWSTTADGFYTTGAQVNVTVRFSETVTLDAGALRVDLSSGASVAITNCLDTNLTAGIYTVAAGENTGTLEATNVWLTAGGDALADPGGNPLVTAVPGVSNFLPNAIAIDTKRPECVANRYLGTNPTNAAGARFELVFDEPVDGLLPLDIGLVAAGTSGSVTDVTPSNVTYATTYTVTVANVQGDGTLGVRVAANSARDRSTNGNRLSPTSAPPCVVDNTLPDVTVEQAPQQGDPTNASPILFSVRFTEPVEGFTNVHVSLAGTAHPTTAQVIPVAGQTDYLVAVGGMTEATGTVSVSVGAGRVSDLAGNTNTVSISIDNEVFYDAVPPVNTLYLADTNPTDASVVGFWIETSEPLQSELDEADIVLHTNNTSYEGLSAVSWAFGGAPYYTYVDVWGVSGDGDLGISVMAGGVRDIAGNANAESAVAGYTIDNRGPVPSNVVVESDAVWTTSTALRVSWSNFIDRSSGVVGYYYSLTNNAGTTNGTYTTETTGVVVNAAYGTNCVYVWGVDNLGHIGTAGSDDILVVPSATVALDVVSAYGTPTPAVGTYTNQYGTSSTNSVTAIDDRGTAKYVCAGWELSGQQPACGTTNEMSMTHVADATLVWLWNTNYWLDIAAGAGGSVTPGDRWVAAGGNVAITATAAPHRHFVSWTGPGTGAVGNVFFATTTVALTMPIQIAADFDLDRHTLSVASAHGAPWAPAMLTTNAYGTLLTNSVSSPDEAGATQYVCAGWTLTGGTATNGDASGAGTSAALELTNDTELAWSWRTNYYLDLTAGAGGSVDAGDGWHAAGSEVVVTAASDPNRRFAGWSGDTSGCSILGTSILIPMDAGRSVTAEFAAELHDLAVVSEHGMALPASGVYPLPHGTNLTCLVTNSPVVMGDTQYVCIGWIGLGSVPAAGGTTNVTFSLTDNSVLSWNWQAEYRLGLEVQGNGSVDAGQTVDWARAGSRVELTAEPAPDHAVEWDGETDGCEIARNRIVVSMDAPRRIVARFVASDADADGMPDWWERRHFAGPTGAQAVADADGDGMDNRREYLAGTIPTDSASVLKVLGIGRTPDGATTITWHSVTNRVYSIYWTDDLRTWSVQPLMSNILGSDANRCAVTNKTAGRGGYYRIETQLAE